MNCKPGELARVIAAPETIAIGIVDRIVTVKCKHALASSTQGEFCWHYSPQIRLFGGGPLWSLEDRFLQPIRDPGDDAKSEDVRPLPADAKEKSGEVWL